jgi:glutaredoxin
VDSGPAAPPRLRLVTRSGCHLCEDALAALRALGREPELLDVDADQTLQDAYGWRVPVLLLNDRVIAEGRLDQQALRRALEG